MVFNSTVITKIFPFQLIMMVFIGLALSDDCINIAVSSNVQKPFNGNDSITYICVKGYEETKIWAIWSDVEVHVSTEPGMSVNVVSDKSCNGVKEKYKNSSYTSFPSFWTWLLPRNDEGKMALSASPYGASCFAISVEPCGPWSVEVIFHRLKLLYPVTLMVGVMLFLKADDIARSIVFYYTAGISIGMILAIFLLLFVISKFIPGRGVGYVFMFCGSSVILYFYQSVKNHIINRDFADFKIFYAYFIMAGIISFLYCYYRGPVKSDRGLDIMRWTLQSSALCAVYYSIRCEKTSLIFVLMLISSKYVSLQGAQHYILTRKWIPYRLQTYFRGPRFITMEEYELEGKVETARALKELREYCESPECNAWKTMSRLKSPKRFASFISDGMDITLEERQTYDDTSFDCAAFLTSDEDSEAELTFGEL